ncbi:MAG: FHA domain-containing protein [Bacteroidota bacterium]
MSSRQTQPNYAKQAGKAIGSSIRILGGANVPAYTLEYLTPTGSHKAGAYETIVIPYVEIGRSSRCAIRIGEESLTVHRRHAAIEKSAQGVIIKHLGNDPVNNPTLINGRPIQQQWFLQNGDIIQLSVGGPQLRFNMSPSGTAKMGFSKKMRLVVQQAVKPYKYAVISILLLLVAIAGLAGFVITEQNKTIEQLSVTVDGYQHKFENQEEKIAFLDSIGDIKQKEFEDQMGKLEGQLTKAESRLRGVISNWGKLKDSLASQRRKIEQLEVEIQDRPVGGGSGGGATSTQTVYNSYKDQIYFLRVSEFKYNAGGTTRYMDISWTGTGFLLDDGKFVTARHCIQGWRFLRMDGSDSREMLIANALEQEGVTLEVTFEAISPNSNRSFAFTYTDTNLRYDDSQDRTHSLDAPNGQTINLKIARPSNDDWAYLQTSKNSDMTYDQSLSNNLKAGERVIILGYSYGGALQGKVAPNPLVSESLVAQDGLNSGLINLTDRNFGQGNSGGPVLAKSNRGSYKVVGIVSAGIGAEIGIIVPVSAIR